MNEQCHLLEGEFCVAGGAWETADTPGFVESRDHWEDCIRKEKEIMNIWLCYL